MMAAVDSTKQDKGIMSARAQDRLGSSLFNSAGFNNSTRQIQFGTVGQLNPAGTRSVSGDRRNGASSTATLPNLGANTGLSNIWGTNGLGTTFGSRLSPHENPATRSLQYAPAQTSTTNQSAFSLGSATDDGSDTPQPRAGSSALMESSVSDTPWNPRPNGLNPRDDGTRGRMQLGSSSLASSAPYTNGNASLPQASTGAIRNITNQPVGPPVTNLTTGGNAHKFQSTFDAGFITYANGQPPTVYTKHGRQNQDTDSIMGESSDPPSCSPSDGRNSCSGSSYFANPSAPSSRHGSIPNTRRGDLPATFTPRADAYTGASSSNTQFYNNPGAIQPNGQATRRPDAQMDQIAFQFGQTNLNNDNYSSLSRRSSNFTPRAGGLMTGRVNGLNSVNGSFHGTDHDSSSVGIEEIARTVPPGTLSDGNYPTAFGGNQSSYHDSRSYERPSPNAMSYARTNGNAVHQNSYTSTFDQIRALQAMGAFPYGLSPEQWAFLNHQFRMSNMSDGPADIRTSHHFRPQSTSFQPHGGQNGYGMYNTGNHSGSAYSGSGSTLTIADAPRGPRDMESGQQFRSTLLEEFKNNSKTNKRYELRDIYGYIVEFSGDQHGSRFIQQKLETAKSDEKERIFQEICPNASQLMQDVFGNYVIQKFFEHGDQNQKKILANKMRGQVLRLSLQMYGCRVVQKALEHILNDQQAALIHELDRDVLRCVKDQNGNHVIQKAIECCDPKDIAFILECFTGQIHILSIHTYGCRVIQRCLEHCEQPAKQAIMAELHDGMASLICDAFGNYVVQHVVEHGGDLDKQRVLDLVSKGLETYSKHKFASNVVEKCLNFASPYWRREVVDTLTRGNKRERDSLLVGLINDQYGNYVIQKLLECLNRNDYLYFTEMLQPEMVKARRTAAPKHLLAIEKKMHRHGTLNCAQLHAAAPFVSHSISANTTPPPLTSDSRSLQSLHTSSAPSINGDATEGASMSRKSSLQPGEPGIYEH